MTYDKLETARNILRDKEEAQWMLGELKDLKGEVEKGRINYVLERLARYDFKQIQEELKPIITNVLDERIKKCEVQIKLADQAFEAL